MPWKGKPDASQCGTTALIRFSRKSWSCFFENFFALYPSNNHFGRHVLCALARMPFVRTVMLAALKNGTTASKQLKENPPSGPSAWSVAQEVHQSLGTCDAESWLKKFQCISPNIYFMKKLKPATTITKHRQHVNSPVAKVKLSTSYAFVEHVCLIWIRPGVMNVRSK